MQNDLKKTIKELHKIKMSDSLKQSRRDFLMQQVNLDFAEYKEKSFANIVLSKKFAILKSLFFQKAFFKNTSVIALMIAIVLGGGVYGVYASEQSLPGEVLYGVKRVKERVRVNLVSSDEKRTEIHLELAGRRLDEINVLKSQPIDTAKKIQNITVAVTDYKEEIAQAKNKLEKVQNTIAEPQKIIKVAELVDQKVEAYTNILKQEVKVEVAVTPNQNKLVTAGVVAQVDEAIKVSKQISNDAVNLIIQQADKPEAQQEVKDKIKTKVLEKIEQAQNEITQTQQDLRVQYNENTQTISNPLIEEAKESKNQPKLEEAVKVEILKEQTQQIQEPQKQENQNKEDIKKQSEQVNQSKINETQIIPPLLQEISKEQTQQIQSTEKQLVPLKTDTVQNPIKIDEKINNQLKIEPQLTEQTKVEVLKVIDEDPKKAKNLLTQASELATQGDLSGALQKVQATQNLVDDIKVKVKELTENSNSSINEGIKVETKQEIPTTVLPIKTNSGVETNIQTKQGTLI